MAKRVGKSEGRESGGVRMLSVDVIEGPSVPIRSRMDEEALAALARSIAACGVLEPLLVRARGRGRWEVVAGHRRLEAARRAGVAVVPVIEVSGGDVEVLRARYHENAYRESVSAGDEAGFFRRLVEDEGLSQAEVARLCGVSEGHVSQVLGSLSWPEDLRRAVDDGVLSWSAARELAAIDDLEALRYYVEAARRGGCSARTAALWRMDYERLKAVAGDTVGVARDVASRSVGGEVMARCGVCGRAEAYSSLRAVWCCGDCVAALESVKRGGADGGDSGAG